MTYIHTFQVYMGYSTVVYRYMYRSHVHTTCSIFLSGFTVYRVLFNVLILFNYTYIIKTKPSTHVHMYVPSCTYTDYTTHIRSILGFCGTLLNGAFCTTSHIDSIMIHASCKLSHCSIATRCY